MFSSTVQLPDHISGLPPQSSLPTRQAAAAEPLAVTRARLTDQSEQIRQLSLELAEVNRAKDVSR